MTTPVETRFTVLIPTRDRPQTLRSALATCLDQDFDNYEVVVCDNSSAPGTEAVVHDAASLLVRYVRAPRALAMTDNWELAIAHARGEFVLVLGDDDGLMPYALRELDALARRLDAPVVCWSGGFYTWPDIALPGQGGYLRVPLRRALRMQDAVETMAAAIRFEAPYVHLPTLYNAAVRRNLLEELRRRCGRVLLGRYPDVYSGFAVGHVCHRYPLVDVPMSIAGVSGGSTGVANLFRRGRSPIDADYVRLNADAGIRPHPWVPDLPVFPEVPVADAFLAAKQSLFPDAALTIDRRQLLAHCLAAAASPPFAPGQSAAVETALRAAAADDPELLQWLDDTLAAGGVPARPEIRLRPDRLGFDGQSLHLDSQAFGVSTIQEAVALAERIVHYRPRAIDYEDGDAVR
jgi:glycosyltransferase involved in cell wall biosynthesis